MRIAFDYQIFSLQACGGISRYVTRLVEHLCAAGQDAKVFSPLHCNEHLDLLPDSLRYGYRISRSASKAMRLTLPYNHLVCQHKMAAWAPGIVHETYFSAFDFKPKAPTVVTVYDMVHEQFPAQFSRINRLCDYKRRAVERADHVICISESTRRDLVEILNVPVDKLSVVHLGFDRFSGQLSPAEHESTAQKRPYLLFVGGRKGYKNFAGMLRAVSLSPRLLSEFDIVAFGGGQLTGDERALMKTLGYDGQQVCQVSGSDADLGLLYKNAAALVYPSLYEGFGLPPLEAMAHNCAVVVSNTSSLPEVVGDAGEYFDPSSPEDMSLAIERVVLSPQNTRTLISKGQERLNHFSWEACAQGTLEVYRKLLG